MSLSSPPATISPKGFDKIDSIPKEVASLSENLQNLIMGRVGQTKVSTRTRKIVIYVCAADSQGEYNFVFCCFYVNRYNQYSVIVSVNIQFADILISFVFKQFFWCYQILSSFVLGIDIFQSE